MKICYFGIYTKDYPRNEILISGFKLNGVELVHCHADWRDKKRYLYLFKKLRALRNEYDLVYVAYPATIPVILAKLFQRKTVVMDAFYSMYDAVVNDRKEISFFSIRAMKLLFLDWLSILCADYVVTDTEAHKKYWEKWFLVKSKKIFPLYLGVNDTKYFPLGEECNNPIFRVHFHGSYIPLQGIKKIVEAAMILKDDPTLFFYLIGKGQEYNEIKELIESYGLKNIEQIDQTYPGEAKTQLNTYLNMADVVLGIFGDTEKAKRVIPNKVYEGMAVRKAVITMDSPAIREVFSEQDVYMIKNTGEEIARAIKLLQNDPVLRKRLAENAYAKIVANYTPKGIGKAFLELTKIFKNKI